MAEGIVYVLTNPAMPPLGQPGMAGEAIRTFLKRQPAWQSIGAEAAAEGQELVPYSFRHRYSATGHGRGLQTKQMADAMGHSLEVHMGNYARFMTRDLASAFDAVNGIDPLLPGRMKSDTLLAEVKVGSIMDKA